ncbi:TPA: hypothetical protein L1580_001843 [Escherichia coli]|uniref:hypothetical protein n=1 Tax=Escherichia coli TaxID=562 RepID=UPI0015EF66C6|nr:hypothetical protein [Escherichia coli]HBL9049719.1 hypothetical protein [Escherichia coli]HBN1754675.1 hypothetical protein [Escherichia coli]HBN2269160.1 hypothetical protein [Escherichia coli]HCU6781271.1 hypothetical protein [Escherichia coli]
MKNPYNRIINELYSLIFPLVNRKWISAIEGFYNNNYIINNKTITKQKNKILNEIKRNVIYYANADGEQLNDYPVVTKNLYRRLNENVFLHKNYVALPKYKMNTGGSTGEPFEFYCDLRAGLIDFYHQKFQYGKMNFTSNDKIYVINGWLPDANNINDKVFWRKKKNKNELPFGSKEFSSHYLNKGNAKYYINELIASPPTFIRSYPSVFSELTKFFIAEGYSKPPFVLKGIQLTSEVISHQQEEFIKSYWGNIIFYQYGHSEAAAIATKYPEEECYTFSPYYGIVEILDDNGRHVQEGETGHIVVTSLNNVVRPFIRYDTGDMATFKGNSNGVVTVYDITGRVQDVVEDKHGNLISITGLVFGQHFHAFKNIISWQIHNPYKGKLIVSIIKDSSYCDDDAKEIKEKLSFNGVFEVSLKYVDEIDKTISGKHRLVIR